MTLKANATINMPKARIHANIYIYQHEQHKQDHTYIHVYMSQTHRLSSLARISLLSRSAFLTWSGGLKNSAPPPPPIPPAAAADVVCLDCSLFLAADRVSLGDVLLRPRSSSAFQYGVTPWSRGEGVRISSSSSPSSSPSWPWPWPWSDASFWGVALMSSRPLLALLLLATTLEKCSASALEWLAGAAVPAVARSCRISSVEASLPPTDEVSEAELEDDFCLFFHGFSCAFRCSILVGRLSADEVEEEEADPLDDGRPRLAPPLRAARRAAPEAEGPRRDGRLEIPVPVRDDDAAGLEADDDEDDGVEEERVERRFSGAEARGMIQ